MMQEVWKSPPSIGKPWLEVSNLGRVRRVDRLQPVFRMGKHQTRLIKGRLLKPSKDTRGRYMIGIGTGGEHKIKLLLILVAECFVENPNPKKLNMVFFKDENRSNCRADNLCWGSIVNYGENLSKNCKMKIPVGLFRPGAYDPFKTFKSIKDFADSVGYSKQRAFEAVKCGRFVREGATGFFVRKLKDSMFTKAWRAKLSSAHRRHHQMVKDGKIPPKPPVVFTDGSFMAEEVDITPKPVFS